MTEEAPPADHEEEIQAEEEAVEPEEEVGEVPEPPEIVGASKWREMSAEEMNERKMKFKKYLEEKGLMDLMTRMLASLYESNEKPNGQEETLEYCRQYFSKLEGFDYDAITEENNKLNERLNEIQQKCDEINKEINGEGEE